MMALWDCYIDNFFFQAEDGIRDIGVTGVQTCALPICLEDTDGEIDVLSKAHLAESAQTHVSITAYAHIERTGIKFIELLFSTANAACREDTCHGVRNGFLHIGKRIVGFVGTTKSVGRLPS